MTTTQELLESSFELNLSNYGPEDVERLNDWAIKAHNALEALQAEHTDEVMRGLMLEKAHAMGLAERDAALARLAELEKQEPVIYQAKTKPGFLSTSAYAWEDCEKADFLVYEADGVHVRGLYAAAGASLVATPIVAWAKSTPRKLRITTMDMGGEDGWRPLGYTAAGASPQQSPLLQFCTCEDCKPMECEGCRINRERRELLPAQGEAAREYMTGYSDCREWAGATNQAQPERAEDSVNAKRYLWLRDEAYSVGGKTPFIVIGRDDSNCHAVSGTTADEAIDAAIKQGGQHE